MNKSRLTQRILLGLLAAWLALLAYRQLPPRAPTDKEKRTIAMQSQAMKTRCVGRYLVDLPEGFILAPSSKAVFFIGLDSDHDLLELVDIQPRQTPETFAAWKQAKLAKWDERSPFRAAERPPSKLAKVDNHGTASWVRTYTAGNYGVYDLHVLDFRDGVGFETINTANRGEEKIATATSRLLDLSKRISRIQDPLKSPAGTCMDELLIAGKYDEESLQINFEHPAHPGWRFKVNFAGIRDDEADNIFDRRRKAEAFFKLSSPSLFERSYSFQGMTANEDAMRSPSEVENGRENFTFQFETRRANGSLNKPSMHVVMEFGQWQDGKQIGTAFSAAEATGLWDKVIKTLRPRPGAI